MRLRSNAQCELGVGSRWWCAALRFQDLQRFAPGEAAPIHKRPGEGNQLPGNARAAALLPFARGPARNQKTISPPALPWPRSRNPPQVARKNPAGQGGANDGELAGNLCKKTSLQPQGRIFSLDKPNLLMACTLP